MKFVNIAPMFVSHKKAVCTDLADLEKHGVITETAFMLKLIPQGTPPADVLSCKAKQFEVMRNELRKHSKMPVGILIQAIIGHGYWLDTPPENFHRLITLAPDDPEKLHHIVCPLDPGFRAYFAKTARKLAELKPDFLLIDDDFRMFAARNACFCDLHIAEYNRRTGMKYTRETLTEEIRKDPETALAYERFVAETFADSLKILRNELDKTAPDASVYYCTCMPEVKYAEKFAKVLASKGKQPVVRLNNGRYTTENMRDFPGRMYSTAVVIDFLKRDVPEILSEPDTCPHNQYSTSAALLNCHMTGSILEGCTGSKHWITSLVNYEPESGAFYRRILKEYIGFYNELFRMRAKKQDTGINALLPGSLFRDYNVYAGESPEKTPAFIVALARMGIPMNYASQGRLPAILDRVYLDTYSDREIEKILSCGAIMDGPSAHALSKRGFDSLLGVRVEDFPQRKVTQEIFSDGVKGRPQPNGTLSLLKPISPETEILSTLQTTRFSKRNLASFVNIGPGTTLYRNKVAVFAGSPFGGPWISEFGFFNQTRKAQILSMLDKIADIPVVYPGTAEFFVKLWKIGKDLVMPFITLGRDDLPELELDMKKIPVKVEFLNPDGEWMDVPFRKESKKRIVVEREFRATRPYALRFR